MKKKLAIILVVATLISSICAVPVMANNGYWYYNSGSYYYIENGYYQTGWIRHNGNWYYCDPYGYYMYEDGLENIGGKNYYFDTSGKMLTGWQYLQAQSGNYRWYYFSSSGAMQYGWQKIGGKWYYLDPSSGAMWTDWLYDNGKWYFLNSSGAMVTGWQWLATDNGGYGWFYFNSSGAQLTGWQKIGGYWYYLNETAYTDCLVYIGGARYLFASSGKMLTGWQKWYTTDGYLKWVYFDPNGAMHIGWLYSGGKWYYLNESMVYGGWKWINGKNYYFDYSGACTNPY